MEIWYGAWMGLIVKDATVRLGLTGSGAREQGIENDKATKLHFVFGA